MVLELYSFPLKMNFYHKTRRWLNYMIYSMFCVLETVGYSEKKGKHIFSLSMMRQIFQTDKICWPSSYFFLLPQFNTFLTSQEFPLQTLLLSFCLSPALWFPNPTPPHGHPQSLSSPVPQTRPGTQKHSACLNEGISR